MSLRWYQGSYPIAFGAGAAGYLAGKAAVERLDASPNVVAAGGLAMGALVVTAVPALAGRRMQSVFRWLVHNDETISSGWRAGTLGTAPWMMLYAALGGLGAVAGAMELKQARPVSQ